MTNSRRRLDPQQRRDQLLEIGIRLFGERPYDDVWIEEVAELAGVSRGLMYHYFPSKREFFTAVVERNMDEFLDATEVDPTLPVAEQLRAGVAAFVSQFVAKRHSHLVINRGAFSTDPQIRELLAAQQATLRQRVLDALGLTGHEREVASLAVWGWLQFVREVCTEWLQGSDVGRDELVELCLRTLVGALGPTVNIAGLPHRTR